MLKNKKSSIFKNWIIVPNRDVLLMHTLHFATLFSFLNSRKMRSCLTAIWIPSTSLLHRYWSEISAAVTSHPHFPQTVSHQYRIKPELHTWEVSTWASSLHVKTLASKPCFFFFSFLLLLSHWRYSALQHQLNRCEINLQRSSILLGTWQWEHCETDWDTCCVSFSCVCFYFYLSTLLI